MILSRCESRRSHGRWTKITGKKHGREGPRYASDTTDEEWALIEPLLPPANEPDRPRTTLLRSVLDALFFMAQSGCQWRMLPKGVSTPHDGAAVILSVAAISGWVATMFTMRAADSRPVHAGL